MTDKKAKTKAERFPPMKSRCGGSKVVGKKDVKKKAGKKSVNKPEKEQDNVD